MNLICSSAMVVYICCLSGLIPGSWRRSRICTNLWKVLGTNFLKNTKPASLMVGPLSWGLGKLYSCLIILTNCLVCENHEFDQVANTIRKEGELKILVEKAKTAFGPWRFFTTDFQSFGAMFQGSWKHSSWNSEQGLVSYIIFLMVA